MSSKIRASRPLFFRSTLKHRRQSSPSNSFLIKTDAFSFPPSFINQRKNLAPLTAQSPQTPRRPPPPAGRTQNHERQYHATRNTKIHQPPMRPRGGGALPSRAAISAPARAPTYNKSPQLAGSRYARFYVFHARAVVMPPRALQSLARAHAAYTQPFDV